MEYLHNLSTFEAMTKLQKLKNHLNSGRRISGLSALKLWGYYRLSDGIYELRKQGMKIETEQVEYNGTKYARYYLK